MTPPSYHPVTELALEPVKSYGRVGVQRSGGQSAKPSAVQAAALCAATRQAAWAALLLADAMRLHGLADSLGWLHATLLAEDWQQAPRTLQALCELQSSHAAVDSALSADASAAVHALIAIVQVAMDRSAASTRAPVRKRAGKPAAAVPSPVAAALAQQAAAPASAPRRAAPGGAARLSRQGFAAARSIR